MSYTAISCLVHENPQILRDQALNIAKFFPEAIFIVHVSESSVVDYSSFVEATQDLPNVFLNPSRMATRWGDMLGPHVLNLEFIFEHFHEVNAVAFTSSTDMLVKSGVSQLLNSNSAGYDYENRVQQSIGDASGTVSYALKCPEFSELRKIVGAKEVVWSQIEGSYYPIDFLKELVGLMRKNCDLGHCNSKYYREEFIIPTLFTAMSREVTSVSYPYILRGRFAAIWADNHVLRYTKNKLVRRLFRAPFELIAPNFWTPSGLRCLVQKEGKPWMRYSRVNGYRRFDIDCIYGIKRVRPLLSDSTRARIRDL